MDCPCGQPLAFCQETKMIATLTCASGHRLYLFARDDGTWETQGQRRERLARMRVCEDCGRDFVFVRQLTPTPTPRRFCNACGRRHVREANKDKQRVRDRFARTPNRNGSRWNMTFLPSPARRKQ